MRRLSKIITAGLLATMTTLTVAKPAKLNDQVMLYAKPNATAKVINKINPASELIPIYEKDQWLKVGDPKDGHVGWINKKQYSQAMQAATQPQVQTFVIKAHEENDKAPTIVAYQNGKKLNPEQLKKYSRNVVIETTREPGKPAKILAYENGKQLDPKESAEVLARMEEQQRRMEENFEMMQKHFQQNFDHEMHGVLTLEPGPVIVPEADMQPAQEKHSLLPNPMKPAQ